MGGSPPNTLANLARHIEVDPKTRCWVWTGYVHVGGYGHVGWHGRVVRVHRLIYEELVGPFPDGFESDHLCNVRRCVNPGHIEPVTHAENMRRRSERQTHCKSGHERSPDNVYYHASGRIVCKTCQATWTRDYEAKKRPPKSKRPSYDEWIADILQRAAS